jgi:hypothetical protein
MKTRTLGALEVSEMGAECMSISANYGPPADRSQRIRVRLARGLWQAPTTLGRLCQRSADTGRRL